MGLSIGNLHEKRGDFLYISPKKVINNETISHLARTGGVKLQISLESMMKVSIAMVDFGYLS